ncbi:hypothetical protein VP1G_08328 [Cytospora mali]|uniref:Uncharacterized protein n=1 Tax=Cytospora mali TaxID=578113 RepID=A0A194VAX8_CYTMA|nr:hypothetical protein VP1G_08328 [Valsa mali var. pyri (nom. inval.)]
MIDAHDLRSSATEYTEAEYQLTKIVAKKIPVDKDARFLFFAEVSRCEKRVHAQSTCKELDEGIALNDTTYGPGHTSQMATQVTATEPCDSPNDVGDSHATASEFCQCYNNVGSTQAIITEPCGSSNDVGNSSNDVRKSHGIAIRGPLLPTGHMRKLVRILGATVERDVAEAHKKLDRLMDLMDSHSEIEKELPKAHDDIKEMLFEQAKCVEELHAKINGLAQLLDDQDPHEFLGEQSGDSDVDSCGGQDAMTMEIDSSPDVEE